MNAVSVAEHTASHPAGKAVAGLALTPFEDYQQSRAHVFPSIESLRWFERQNRAELIAKGAVSMPTGRKLVVADKFDAVVLEIGQRLAAHRGARGGAGQ